MHELYLERYDFYLPPHLIAQFPQKPRDSSRLMVVKRKSGEVIHTIFRKIHEFLTCDHVIIINNTKVLPARLHLKRKKTKGSVRILLLTFTNPSKALLEKKKRLEINEILETETGEDVTYLGKKDDCHLFQFPDKFNIIGYLDRYGKLPLPPYIKRDTLPEDKRWYQTVYARVPGSIAAPTAGLHFTNRVFKKLREKGIEILEITLHVGIGTFKPIKSELITQHKMEEEFYHIEEAVAEKLIRYKKEGKKIIAVGTTTVRALESWNLDKEKEVGLTNLFIYPGYKFKVIDGMVTNFHLPKSTPLLLVSALLGVDFTLHLYQLAIKEGYRFFSYGDAMLILP